MVVTGGHGEPTQSLAPNRKRHRDWKARPELAAQRSPSRARWNIRLRLSFVLGANNNASGAIYTDMALATAGGANCIYVTNIHSGAVEVYDGTLRPVGSQC